MTICFTWLIGDFVHRTILIFKLKIVVKYYAIYNFNKGKEISMNIINLFSFKIIK